MKILSLAFIACAFALAGRYISLSFSRRIRLLEKAIVMLGIIRTDIDYLRMPANEVLVSLASNTELKDLSFLPACITMMNSGSDFISAWQKSLSDIKGMKKQDVDILISFGNMFGRTDVSGQLSNCDMHISLLENNLKDAREMREKYSSLSCGIGALAGIGVFIIMI